LKKTQGELHEACKVIPSIGKSVLSIRQV